ncbi:hypothetical protein ACG1BZ_09320 [Microbulbifer sp. CNSA002]|uniref:hypothetical protein n=1 Tax=Microbulbifer sp. CNSA002 TaxID=3373604 RepID=UPI0039B62133
MKEKKLYEFGPNWEATRIAIERKGHERILSFSVEFEKEGEVVELEFLGPKDIDSLPELIDVEHVIVLQEINSQRELGTIKLEFLGECWQEIWCDSVSKVGQT